MATSVDSSEGMYIVPAFSGLYAPYWRSDARGVMVGLTRMINKNRICRAVLEATEDTKLLEFSLDSFVILAHVAAYFNLTVGAGAGGEA